MPKQLSLELERRPEIRNIAPLLRSDTGERSQLNFKHYDAHNYQLSIHISKRTYFNNYQPTLQNVYPQARQLYTILSIRQLC